MQKQRLRRGLALGLLMALVMPVAFAQTGLNIEGHLVEHGWNAEQIDAAVGNAWYLDGQMQMYGFGDDPLSEPGVSEEEAAGTVPIAIGVEYVRFYDPALLPIQVTEPTELDHGGVAVNFGNGPMEVGVTYAWFWAEMKGDINYLDLGAGYNWAFPTSVRDATVWESSFAGDSWTGGSHIPFFYNDPTASDPISGWMAGMSIANDSGGLDSYNGAGGMAWFADNMLGIYVPADAIMSTATPIEAYGYAADYTRNAGSQFDPNAPRKVTVFPGNFTADGRQGGLEAFDADDRFLINVGFEPYADITRAGLLRDAEDNLWLSLHPLRGWPTQDPTDQFLEAFFSLGAWGGITYGEMSGPFVVADIHDGERRTTGFFDSQEFVPTAGYVLNDGSLRVSLNYNYSQLLDDTETVTVFGSGSFWLDGADEDGRRQTDAQWQVDVASIPMLDFSSEFGGLYPTFDLVNFTNLDPPTEPEPEESTDDGPSPETTQPVSTEEEIEPTLGLDLGDNGDGGTDWLRWALGGLLIATVLGPIFLWFKALDWWTCWLPWFIGIFVWVPFLLACLWWGRPDWWWIPLTAWFPIIGGYTWYWARERSWWKDEYLYYVGGYLAVLLVATVLVGAPEWGLLFPFYWVPWVAFYVWFRGQRQPWWEPWMWGATVAYVVWNIVWVAALTPWWAWWLPVATVGFVGFWFPRRGYEWSALWLEPKWCWTIPFVTLPFLLWWLPVWGDWWLVVLVLVLLMLVGSFAFQQRREGWQRRF